MERYSPSLRLFQILSTLHSADEDSSEDDAPSSNVPPGGQAMAKGDGQHADARQPKGQAVAQDPVSTRSGSHATQSQPCAQVRDCGQPEGEEDRGPERRANPDPNSPKEKVSDPLLGQRPGSGEEGGGSQALATRGAAQSRVRLGQGQVEPAGTKPKTLSDNTTQLSKDGKQQIGLLSNGKGQVSNENTTQSPGGGKPQMLSKDGKPQTKFNATPLQLPRILDFPTVKEGQGSPRWPSSREGPVTDFKWTQAGGKTATADNCSTATTTTTTTTTTTADLASACPVKFTLEDENEHSDVVGPEKETCKLSMRNEKVSNSNSRTVTSNSSQCTVTTSSSNISSTKSGDRSNGPTATHFALFRDRSHAKGQETAPLLSSSSSSLQDTPTTSSTTTTSPTSSGAPSSANSSTPTSPILSSTIPPSSSPNAPASGASSETGKRSSATADQVKAGVEQPESTKTSPDISPNASMSDFADLKSAMRKSSQQAGVGMKMRLFDSVLRRVSIHRKESTPAGRIATFFFGPEDDAKEEQKKGPPVKEPSDSGSEMDKPVVGKKKIENGPLRESLYLILSGMYGITVVILGSVIPITEVFISDETYRVFEVFYIYLYVTSCLFLAYVYAYLLRRNRLKTEFLTRTLTRSLSWSRSSARSWTKGDRGDKGDKAESDIKSRLRKRMISLDVSNHHTGTFYLRLGVLGFGIGSMIHSGLNFGTYFVVSAAACNESLQAGKPLAHLVFTFFQLYFIFMNSKMCIHRYKKLARFGLMHMCATNICVWFRSIVVETLHVIHTHKHTSDHHNPSYTPSPSPSLTSMASLPDQPVSEPPPREEGVVYEIVNATFELGRKLHSVHEDGNDTFVPSLSDSCRWSNMMTDAVEAAGPYLYPCTIEYSLMCAGILYIMWRNVGKRPRRPRELEVTDEDEDMRSQRMSVDCTSSSRGLFLGILLMVGTIISIIAFYMLVTHQDLKTSAIILSHLSETAVYTGTLMALVLATLKMKSLTFHNEHEADLEDILILISYTGLLVFIIFGLVASILHEPETRSILTILSHLTMLIQSTVQTMFMLAGDRMSACTELQERKKPGREFVTFLLISNFAMWAIMTFETQTPYHNPVQVEFYGPEAWAIFTHISAPLGIYYRFHSTVCLSNIWKNAWKKRKHII